MTERGNLGGIFGRWVGTDRVAFVDVTGGDIERPVEVGYDEFEDRSARVAAGLLARGLERGDRVGLVADNSVDYGACYFGIARAGLVTVPLNTRQPAETLAWVATDAGLAAIIHDAANRDRVPPGVPAIELGTAGWATLLDHPPAPVAEMEPDEVAVQMYTSGSTGRPKGVLLTHGGQLFSIGLYLSGVMPMDPDERLLVSAPMYHKNAAMQLKMALSLGGSVVLLRRFDADDYLRAIDRHRVTAMTGVPTMFALMFARTGLLDTLDRSSVRRLSIGSAPMTQALFDRARELFPGCVITNGYGTTEVVAVFGGHPDGAPRPDTSVGHPLAEVETKLIDPETGAEAEIDPETGHRQGELWVRSGGVMAGYHGLPEVTAARLTDGWYHTGDVMVADENGWHFFVGRVDDMFSCAGENVYPGDVEQMLERHPAIHQAAVVPVDDELKGALPVAFVVPLGETAVDEAAIKAWSLENGPAYQHPRAVWLVDELPLAGTAKIDKAALATEAARRWTPRHIVGHYTRPDLLTAIEQALASVDKSPDTVEVEDLAPADEFHIGGRMATAHLFDQLSFDPGAHVLDIGCGIGGAARFAAGRVERVTGIDLTPDYVDTGNAINGWFGLADRIDLQVADALATGLADQAFDGGYLLHVGMNIEDKVGLLAEAARLLRPGARFGIYDIMRPDGADGDSHPEYPVPWASDRSTSHLAPPEDYVRAAEAAGFTVVAQENRGSQAVAFFDRLAAQAQDAAQAGSGPPALGLHLIMGPTVATKVANMVAAVRSGLLAPVELLLQRA